MALATVRRVKIKKYHAHVVLEFWKDMLSIRVVVASQISSRVGVGINCGSQ
jgi:hypothetical protein